LGGASSQVTWANNNFVTGLLRLGDERADATVDFQNPIDLIGGARTVSAANSPAAIEGVLSGVISDSSTGGNLIKDGGGTLKVTAANTYGGGTTIISGRLLVSNTTGSGTGSGAVAVNAGTLGGTGSISGTVTVASGAHVAPGESVESLDVGSLILNTGSILDFELGAPGSPGITSDLINVTATNGLTANGGTVNLTDAGGLASGTYVLIDYSGSLSGGVGLMTLGTQPAGFSYSLVNNPGNSSVDLHVNALGLPGDFNSDGKVDAGDYVTWRKNDGTNNALANDNGLGTPVGLAHFNLWRANFGNPPGSGSGGGLGGASAVPEPAAVSLLWAIAPLVAMRRRGFARR
jgi:autotransporter-associated beta strand protein